VKEIIKIQMEDAVVLKAIPDEENAEEAEQDTADEETTVTI
jgi:hypothetical protein